MPLIALVGSPEEGIRIVRPAASDPVPQTVTWNSPRCYTPGLDLDSRDTVLSGTTTETMVGMEIVGEMEKFRNVVATSY